MKHPVQFLLFASLLLAMAAAGPGCTEQPPDIPTVTIAAEEAVEVARDHLDEAGKVLEQAALRLDSAAKTLDALSKFRSAYDGERYSEALSHLEKALAEAEAAGYAAPPEAVERLGQAKLLLQLAGK